MYKLNKGAPHGGSAPFIYPPSFLLDLAYRMAGPCFLFLRRTLPVLLPDILSDFGSFPLSVLGTGSGCICLCYRCG